MNLIDVDLIRLLNSTSECTVVKVQSVGILSAASMHGQSSITALHEYALEVVRSSILHDSATVKTNEIDILI